MRSKLAIVAISIAVGVSGCANMTTTEQRVLSGAALGGLGGAAIAAIASSGVATGAAIGAGVGAGAGYVYSRSRNGDMSAHQAAYHPVKHQKATRAAKPQLPAPDPSRGQLLASNWP